MWYIPPPPRAKGEAGSSHSPQSPEDTRPLLSVPGQVRDVETPGEILRNDGCNVPPLSSRRLLFPDIAKLARVGSYTENK